MSPLARSLKRTAKRSAIPVARAIGSRLPTAASRRWLCDHVAPVLMDSHALPRARTTRRLRFLDVMVPCDPYVYVHRNTFWCGVFFEEEVESFLLREVGPGDSFVDVGCNVGHVALPAAKLVGPRGTVVAFEPQPELAAIVRASARAQGLPLEMHECGLGEESGEFTLQIDPEHLGGATFRPGGPERSEAARAIRCAVRRGDDVLADRELRGRVFLKIDVEGHEVPVLRGLERTLRRVHAAIVEVSPKWLHTDGVEELFGCMARAGLSAREIQIDGRLGAHVRPRDVTEQRNLAFAR